MSNMNKILTALTVGVAIGSALGVLFAPDKGEHTRKKIAQNGKKLSDSLLDTIKANKQKLNKLKNNLYDDAEALKQSTQEYAS